MPTQRRLALPLPARSPKTGRFKPDPANAAKRAKRAEFHANIGQLLSTGNRTAALQLMRQEPTPLGDRSVKFAKGFGPKLAKFARGNDAVSAVAKQTIAGKPVLVRTVLAAIGDLRARQAPADVVQTLVAATDAAKAVRSNPSRDELPYVELDGNMSPKTLAKLDTLLRERLPSVYPIAAHDGSDEVKIMRRRRIDSHHLDPQARQVYRLDKARMLTLVPSLLRSSIDAERSLGSAICTTLEIGII